MAYCINHLRSFTHFTRIDIAAHVNGDAVCVRLIWID